MKTNNKQTIANLNDRAAEILASWGTDLPFARPSAVAWVLRCEKIEHDDDLVAELVRLVAAAG